MLRTVVKSFVRVSTSSPSWFFNRHVQDTWVFEEGRRDFRPKSVIARVPASVANLGPGFDVHSIALKSPEIQIEFKSALSGSRILEIEGAYAREVTSDPQFHASAKALNAVFEQFGRPAGYSLKIQVNIPPRKGLGLSGAEAVGAVLCANRLFNLGLDIQAVARLAAAAEPSHHMDNVAASALGGFNIISWNPQTEEPQIMTLRPPADLGIALVVPDIEKASTEATRGVVLPDTVSREQYVRSMGYAARISAAFAKSDITTIIETLPWDDLVEPARAEAGSYGRGVDSRILREEKKMLLDEFHVAETISGAGPSRALWYSISENSRSLRKRKSSLIENAIEKVSDRLQSLGHSVSEVFITKPSARGATLKSTARARA
jgi:homoserine kinase